MLISFCRSFAALWQGSYLQSLFCLASKLVTSIKKRHASRNGSTSRCRVTIKYLPSDVSPQHLPSYLLTPKTIHVTFGLSRLQFAALIVPHVPTLPKLLLEKITHVHITGYLRILTGPGNISNGYKSALSCNCFNSDQLLLSFEWVGLPTDFKTFVASCGAFKIIHAL